METSVGAASAAESPGISQSKPRPRWGMWTTVGWAIGAGAVTLAAQLAVLVAFISWWQQAYPGQPIGLRDLAAHGPTFGVVTVATTPITLAVFLLAVRLARVPFAEYLALRWPSGRDLLIGLVLIVILLPAGDIVTAQSGRDVVPEFMTGTFATAREAGPLFLFLYGLSLVVMAPVSEEIIFRGFLFRGFVSRLGMIPAVIITSAIWSLLHVQYEWLYLAQIFVLGLVFGLLRQRSGSTILTIILHAIINGVALVQVALYEAA